MFQSLYNEARRSVIKRIESKVYTLGNFFGVDDYSFQTSCILLKNVFSVSNEHLHLSSNLPILT